MIKIYGMSTCIDCTNLNYLVKNNNKYEVIDIGLHVKDLKAFLNLRDNHAVFDQAKKIGSIGIPCFVLEDGTVTLNPEEAGLTIPPTKKSTCNIDGSGCDNRGMKLKSYKEEEIIKKGKISQITLQDLSTI